MEKIRISVRNLVEFILRSGDIDLRRGSKEEKDAMQEGNRLHRKIQNSMGPEYIAEVPLKIELPNENYLLVVEGRADGIQVTEEKVMIDEIKCMYMELEHLKGPFELHLAQAKCYAYIYALQEGLKEITVQMTYCQIETEEIRRFSMTYTWEELAEWFDDLIAAYRKWADLQYEWKKIRQESIWQLDFPFPYRKGQKKLAQDVYRTINRRKILFIQAPTGVGKTITTLYPAVKAVGEGLGEKIFYLTAKTITKTVAEDTFEIFREHGFHGKTVTITAKEKLCLCEKAECDPIHCPYAKGHYDRVNDAVYELLLEEEDYRREKILEQAQKHKVCPFEMCLDLALWSDAIICDYNYAFDPNVRLKRFFGDGIRGDYLFLIDEAHNLVDRAREMYSATLYKESLLELKKRISPYSKSLEKALKKCNDQLLSYKRECETYVEYESIGGLWFALMQLSAAMERFEQKKIELVGEDQEVYQEFYFQLRHFLNIYELVDEHYVIYTRHEEDGRFAMRLYCVDPSLNLQECLDKANSSILFSATFLPIHYYKDLLSTREDNYAVYAQTAFQKEQSLLAIAPDVSSRYTRRDLVEYQKIVSYILTVVCAKKGNYMVFFPSYQLMRQVYEAGMQQWEEKKVEILQQTNSMTEKERETFLEQFQEEREKSFVAFCVLGGIFGEGIDLTGDRLIGSIIVGNGFPGISYEREILKKYYDERNGQGFDYAFRYPGMNKVLQAAGRVIRTTQDQGVILLLEERFLEREYRALFPLEWSECKVLRQEALAGELHRFWSKKDGSI